MRDPLVSTSIFKRPEVREVEKLVADVYNTRYGPEGWERRAPLTRAAIVQCAIDTAREGARSLVHTDKEGQTFWLDSTVVLAALGEEVAS